MKRVELKELLVRYERIALGSVRHLPDQHTLKEYEAEQLNNWLHLYQNDRNLRAGQILSREELAEWLSFGIWYVNHLSEWISVLDVNSNYAKVREKFMALDRAGLMRVPLGQGTIGYVAEKATSLADRLYIVEDCEADLRGTVAVEDRWLGNLNAIVVPVVSFWKGLHRVHAVFWLFHPIPRLFTRDYAKKFAEAVQPLGQELGHFFEVTRYRHLIQSIQTTAQSERSRGPASVSLDEKLREIVTRITHINKEDEIWGIRFPWVALLHCTPGQPFDITPGAGIPAWSPLKTWVEPNSFMNSRQKKMSDRLIRAYKQDKQFLPQVKMLGKIDFLKKSEWGDDDVCDLVLPLPDGDTICGLVRVHLSTYLLNDDSDRWHDIARRLESDLCELGTAIGVLRSKYNQTFREKKIEREWERALFREFFHAILTNDSKDLRLRLEEICKALWEHTNASSTKSAEDRLVNILCSVTVKLRPLNLREECVLGISYWTCSEEMLLVEQPPGELDDPHLLRDLQRALTLLITTGNRRHDETVVTWPDDGLAGRIKVGGMDVDGIPCYFHLELTSIGTENKGQQFDKLWITPTMMGHYDVAFSRPGEQTRELRTRWQLCPQVQMIRTWDIRESTGGESELESLAAHLDLRHKVRAQGMGPTLKALQQWWDPRDGLVARATPFDILPGEAPEPGCIWTDPSGRPDRTALRTLLLHLAADEIRDLSQIWTIPLQVLDHVYYWVLVGVGHKPSEGEKDLFQVVLDQIQASVGNIAAEVDRETLQRVFLLEFERRDAWHQLKIPLEGVKSAIRTAKERKDYAFLDQAHKHLRAIEGWFLLWAQKVNEGYNGRAGNSLREILLTALGFAKRRNPDQETYVRACLKPAIEGLGKGVLEQKFRLGRPEKYGLLVLLCTDLLLNAAKHSGFRKVTISWEPTTKALTVRNPIPEGKALVLSKAIPVLNGALRVTEFEKEWQTLKKATFAVDEQGAGLLNIFSAACRLRLGINFRSEPGGDSGMCAATVFLRRFLMIH